jgi:hypothetical protein
VCDFVEGAAKGTAHEALPSSLVAVSKTEDHVDRSDFRIKMQDATTEEGSFYRVVFSDESTFHISGGVHRDITCVYVGNENPHEMVQHERASPKIIFLGGRNVHTKGLWAFLFP